MRRSPLKWFFVLLLCAAGVWFFCREGRVLKSKIGQQSVATAGSSLRSIAATNALKVASASAVTNKFPWRLSNTSKPLSQLIHDPHAILLDNAFIETGAKLNLPIPKNLQSQGDPGAYIVQARGLISPAFRALLAGMGATVVSYIPNDAYLVRATAAVADALSANPLVQAVIPYEPYYKVQSPLLAMAQQTLSPQTQLNLGLFADDAAATIQQIEQMGGIIVSEENSAAGYPIVKVEPPSDWTAVAALPGVHIVEPIYSRSIANDLARGSGPYPIGGGVSLGIAADSITTSNYLNLSGSNVMVEVDDTGVDTNHPDLQGRVFYHNPALGVDTDGHGTHVAGIIAGSGLESTTVTNASGSSMPGTNYQFRGKAPLATMLAMSYNDSDQDLQEAAAETNILISNNSWVYDGDYSYDLAAASYDAATRDALPFTTGAQPVLFVFAAGNDGNVAGDVDSPGTAKDVMTVAALEELRYITNYVTNLDVSPTPYQPWLPETEDPSQVPSFSSCGNVDIGTEGTYGRFKPDVVAPGTFVVSCRSTEWDTNAYYNPTNDTEYIFPDNLQTDAVSDAPFEFFVPSNAVNVIFQTVTNAQSPIPLPPLAIYYSINGGPFTYLGTNIPPGGTNVIPGSVNGLDYPWSVEASNTVSRQVAYDMDVDVLTTNDAGNYYQVLEGLNNSLGTSPEYYRYETGTSMSAAGISGFLALIEDYLTNQYAPAVIPSPALLKAMVINGARPTSGYYLQVNNSINYEGWGIPQLSNSVPTALTNLPTPGDIGVVGPPCSTYFRDQNISNALATGDSETFVVNLNTNDYANYLPLQVTLAWTDPPGDPSSALKTVNNLELVVTDLDNPSIVYYGNDIGAQDTYNTVESSTNPPIIDTINNVQNIFIQPYSTNAFDADADYSVTVKGYSVNVNAVTEQTNNDVQDYALVISSGDMGEITNALTVTDDGIISNPTGDQDITAAQTNTILLNQIAGGNTPLLGTNTVLFTTNTVGYGANGQFSIGMTNQWHFYIVTNTTGFPNAAFIAFGATTLSIPRMGVFANSDANATTPGANIDLLVTRSSTDPNASELTNLSPVEISNCVNEASGDSASLVYGGTDFVAYTNAQDNEVYYIGVKSESQMAVTYGFIPIFTQTPFSSLFNGNEYVNAVNVPSPIPAGTPSAPGISYVFGLALFPVEIGNVVVTNIISHQNFGDLLGSLTHDGQTVVLNNHDSLPSPPGPYKLVYDDSSETPGASAPDGPGNLNNFIGAGGEGVWQWTQEGTALGQTGEVLSASLFLQKYQKPTGLGVTAVVQPDSWYYTFVDVPDGITNLEVFGTNLVTTPPPQPMQMYVNYDSEPTSTNYIFEALLTNSIAPDGPDPGNVISVGPPLEPGVYYIGLYNPNSTPETNYVLAVLNGPSLVAQPTLFSDTNAVPIVNDAVTSTNTTIFISNTNMISSANVGFVVQYPRISDLAFTLISPTGQRILLMENRGGPLATNAGGLFDITNLVASVTASSTTSPPQNTNYINNLESASGSLSIFYDFLEANEMTVYYGTNPATFNATSGDLLYDSGMVSGSNTVTVNFGPGPYTSVTIVMNQFGNTNVADTWSYTVNGTFPDYNYLTFTDDTNLTTTPIEFAIPPFDLRSLGTNYIFSDLDSATDGDYFGQTNIYDTYGGWTVASNLVAQVITNTLVTNNYNEVSVFADPAIAYTGSNYLALGYGILQRTNFVTPYRIITVSYAYRGPGISGWWRGEGNADDSSGLEPYGLNGSLIGRFDFPEGEVGQAFAMENNGQEYEFAGTNGYVQIRQQPFLTTELQSATNGVTNAVTVQSSYLNVGAGPGLTIEGWIDPTNVSFQQPLVEWLAGVPTNGSDTNLTIQAGPFLYRGTDHYYYLLGATNWSTSETWAEELGGHLATVATADAQNWIYDTFADYGGRNRNLWIGLTNFDGVFYGYSSGPTNIAYTNWLSSQPLNCDDTKDFTLMFGATNQYPGLWALADNNGTVCESISNIVYGVVEVTNLQTNGVQFWISVTNVPGATNVILTNSGCLFANLVDITNGFHWIYSVSNLVQSNVFQYVALTYNTNSGIANLYYDGTNVASTNLGVFIPKTTGDVLLGKDMNLETNNYYGGLMDEMSIYGRALSDAEIEAIYSSSAYTTNRLIGKFNPSIAPPFNLAEAQVVLGTMTNTLLGANNIWQVGSFSFTSQTNVLPMQITGIEPGMLLDDFSLSEAALGNLYYQPEQSLDELNNESANGDWTLEIWNTRLNALATNATLLSWQLQMVLQTNTLPPVSIGSQEPTTVTVLPGQTVTLVVSTPSWATVATNILDSSTQPLNVFFNQTTPPTGSSPGDTFMFSGATGSEAIYTNSAPTNFIPGQTYYIGLQNTGSQAAEAVFEVDFNITGLTNDVPFSGTLATNTSLRYFSFNVTSTNAYEATFQLLKLSGNADLVVSKGTPLPTLTSADYGSFNGGRADQNVYVLTNSAPVPLSPGTWYLGVFNNDTHAVNYTVLAQELDMSSTSTTNNMTLIQLTNGVPFDYTAGPGAALTNFFYFVVTNTITETNGILVTNFVPSIRFELYNLTGNGDLTVETNAPPFAPPFFQSSDQPGTIPEYIQISTNSALTNLAATWYLGVPNNTAKTINFTILAMIDTNNVFPAFPGAEGAGAGALGASIRNGYGTNNTVYHVINLNDSGSGSLRDAVSSTNRTVVFDISGVIYLQSPLIITNSYLTIEGQTAPEGGITVAGQTVAVQSAHDVVIRDVRFCSDVTETVETNSFATADAGDYTNGQSVAGWTVLTNEVSIVTDPTNAYQGSNFLALANGVISNTLPTVTGKSYIWTFAYRGPGIVSMWLAQGNANDCIGTNNGSISNTVTFVPGEVGMAFNLGASGFVLIPPSPSLGVGSGPGFTIDGWIEPQDVTSTWHPIAEWSQDDYYAGPLFHIIGTPPDGGPGSLYGNIVDSPSGAHYIYTTANVLTAGVFQHVAINYNHTTGEGSIYLNGAVMTNVNLGVFTPWTTNFYFVLGREINDFDSSANNSFDGMEDDMSLYNRALSDAEINAIYQNGSAGKYDSANPFPQNLAEARIKLANETPVTVYGGNESSTVIYGSNTTWQVENITFTAAQTGTPVEIQGLEPGVLIGSSLVLAPTNPGDAFQLNTVSNVIADHISALWSSNDDLSVLNSSNVTVQWSLISDSLDFSNQPPPNGALVRYGGGSVTLHHNLFANNYTGSPRLGDDVSLDFVNNVIYDWVTNAGYSSATDILNDPDGFTNYLNYRCNYLIAGPDTITTNIAFWGGTTNTWIFQTNNFIDSDTNGTLNGANTEWNMFTNRFTETNQFPLPPISVDEAYMAYEKVLDFAGVDMFRRGPGESNIVENVRIQNGVIVNSSGLLPTESSSLCYLDTADDGIPDFWKVTYGQAITNAENNNTVDSSGYSELEEFDNWLAAPHALTVTNAPVAVKLPELFGKTGNLSFFLTNAIQGTVYLTNVLGSYTNTSTFSNSIAIFTPTNNPGSGTNYYGYASFGVYVTNNDTMGYFGPVTVSVFVSAVPPSFTSSGGALINGESTTNFIGANTITWYSVSVPTNAVAATNTLLYAGLPMNLWFSSNAPPETAYSNDFDILPASTNGTAIVNVDGAPLPPILIPGSTYYLGVQNTNNFATNYAVEVYFDLINASEPVTILNGGSPVTNTLLAVTSSDGINPAESSNGSTNAAYYTVLVPPNAISATNILLFTTNGSVNLWFNQTNLPTFGASAGDYELISGYTGATPTNITLTSSSVPPLVPGQPYYLAVQNAGSTAVTYALEVNFGLYYTPPALPAISNQTVVAGDTLIVTNTATDTNAGTLFYYLTTAPPVNASISGSGVISWAVPTNTPAENVVFTTVVSNAYTLATATNEFNVTVLPLISTSAPQTNSVAAGSVNWLAVQVPRDAAWATNTLLFATNLPVNVLFTTNFPPATNGAPTLMRNASSGVSVLGTATAPTNIISGGDYYLGIQNTNDMAVGYAVQVTFGLYSPPVLPAISNQVITAGSTLVVTNTATDTNPGTLVYTLATSPSVNATVSTNGIITWATTTNQAATNVLFTTIVTNSFTTLSATNEFTVTVLPYHSTVTTFFSGIIQTNIDGTNGFLLTWYAPTNDTFQVQETGSLNPPPAWKTFTNVVTYTGPQTPTNGLFTFFDNGSEYHFGAMRFYRLLLLEQGNSLVLPGQSNYVVSVSQPLVVTNTAIDSNPDALLAYSLTNFPPVATNAMISTNGIIQWTPGPADAGSAFTFTTVVTDNSPASATNAFTVFVLPAPVMAGAAVTYTNVTLSWTASSNDVFQVEWTTNLTPTIVWTLLPQTITSSTGLFTFTDTNPPIAMKFYRLVWLPPQ